MQSIHELSRSLADVLYDSLQSQLEVGQWQYAFLDSRGTVGSRTEKFRAVLLDGSMQGLECPLESVRPIKRLFEVGQDPNQTSPVWYGMRFRIYPDKTYTVEYLYDPDSMEKFDFKT